MGLGSESLESRLRRGAFVRFYRRRGSRGGRARELDELPQRSGELVRPHNLVECRPAFSTHYHETDLTQECQLSLYGTSSRACPTRQLPHPHSLRVLLQQQREHRCT